MSWLSQIVTVKLIAFFGVIFPNDAVNDNSVALEKPSATPFSPVIYDRVVDYSAIAVGKRATA
jgi:hypothetical protein